MDKKIMLLLSIISLALILFGHVSAAQYPILNAGPDLYVTSRIGGSNSSGTLYGSAYDSNDGPLSFYWTCNGGTLSSNSVAQPVYTAKSIDVQATFTCVLTVTNKFGLSSTDVANIYVNYNINNIPNYKVSVQTNPATNNYNGQAVLSGTITTSNYPFGTIYAWFQWGTTTFYGFESNHRTIGYTKAFDQHIANLLLNTTYHFRAVVQQDNGTVIYGDDLVFNSSGYAVAYPEVGQVLGASYVSKGLTNDSVKDSFFFPIMIIILGSWLYFTGRIYTFADWLKVKIN